MTFRDSMSSRCAAVLVALALGASGASAQSWQVEDEIDYATSMARYRLFDLATEYLDRIGAGSLGEEDKMSLQYARAKLEKFGGEYAGGDEERLAFLRQALANYEAFLSSASPTHDRYRTAQSEEAESYRALGALIGRMVHEGTLPKETRAEAEDAFRKAAKQLNQLYNGAKKELDAIMNALGPDDDPESPEFVERRLRAHEPLLQLAAAHYEWAMIYDKGEFNYNDYLGKCTEYAETFVWEVTDESLLTTQVYLYDGLARLAMDDTNEALARLEMVVDPEFGAPGFMTSNEDLPKVWVNEITRMVEQAYLALARYFNDKKEYERTEEFAGKLEAYYAQYKNWGTVRGDEGDLVLLELGMAQFNLGNAAGMKLLEEVARRHPDDAVGSRAGAYIGDVILNSDTTKTIAPTVWITAAEADVESGDSLSAIDKYHRALAAMDAETDDSTAATLSLDSWNAIGKQYRNLKRYVEAALAFEQGVKYRGRAKDEDVVREKMASLGIAWFNTLTLRHKETKNREDKRRKDQAMRKLEELGIEEMLFLVAKDDFDAARVLPAAEEARRKEGLKDAVDKFQDVPKSDNSYEKALVYIARCEAQMGNYKKALKLIGDYEKRLEDSRYDPAPTEAQKRANREVASTEATYYKSLYLAEEGRHSDVITALVGFEQRFPGQEGFFPLVNYQRLRSLLASEPPRIPEAETLFANTYEQKLLPAEGLYFLARALLDRAVAAKEAGDEAAAKEMYSKGGSYLYKYCEYTGFDSYPNLKAAANAYYQVEAWEDAERIYRKVVDLFEGDSKNRKDVEENVRRTLAEILLSQRKFQDAAVLYQVLLEMPRFSQNRDLMRQAALSYGGWVDVVDGRASEVPGAGMYPEAIALWDTIVEKGYERETKYEESGWWEAKYQTIYTRHRAKELSVEWKNQAKKILDNIFANVIDFYPEDEREGLLGGKDWMRRWDYLRGQVK